MKTCHDCKREFDWRDFGSSEKFERSRLCPDCDHEYEAMTPKPEPKEGAKRVMTEPWPGHKLETPDRFNIKFVPGGRGYVVSIPNLESAEVVFADVHDRLTQRCQELEKALDGLLDGLDSNYDPERCGLDTPQWEKRIKTARKVLDEECDSGISTAALNKQENTRG